jgi:hypothetical protein
LSLHDYGCRGAQERGAVKGVPAQAQCPLKAGENIADTGCMMRNVGILEWKLRVADCPVNHLLGVRSDGPR